MLLYGLKCIELLESSHSGYSLNCITCNFSSLAVLNCQNDEGVKLVLKGDLDTGRGCGVGSRGNDIPCATHILLHCRETQNGDRNLRKRSDDR